MPLGLVTVRQEEAPVDAVEDEVAEHVHKQLLGFSERGDQSVTGLRYFADNIDDSLKPNRNFHASLQL